MTPPQNAPSTAVWYFVAGTFSLVGAVFILTWSNMPLAAAAIPLILGAALLIVGAVVFARAAKARRSASRPPAPRG